MSTKKKAKKHFLVIPAKAGIQNYLASGFTDGPVSTIRNICCEKQFFPCFFSVYCIIIGRY